MSKLDYNANRFWAKTAYNSKAKALIARKCTLNEWLDMYDAIEKQWGIKLYPGQDSDHPHYLHRIYVTNRYPFETLNVNSDLFA